MPLLYSHPVAGRYGPETTPLDRATCRVDDAVRLETRPDPYRPSVNNTVEVKSLGTVDIVTYR